MTSAPPPPPPPPPPPSPPRPPPPGPFQGRPNRSVASSSISLSSLLQSITANYCNDDEDQRLLPADGVGRLLPTSPPPTPRILLFQSGIFGDDGAYRIDYYRLLVAAAVFQAPQVDGFVSIFVGVVASPPPAAAAAAAAAVVAAAINGSALIAAFINPSSCSSFRLFFVCPFLSLYLSLSLSSARSV